MIVLADQRMLLLTPPHTASRTLHYSLCSQLGAIWRDGPSADGSVVDHHTATIGAEFAGWTRAVVVRNPFTRLLGLWYHLVDWCRFNGHGCCGFHEFAEWVRADDAARLSYMYRYTISRWLGDVDAPIVIRYEQLEESLETLLGQTVQLHRQPGRFGNRSESITTPRPSSASPSGPCRISRGGDTRPW